MAASGQPYSVATLALAMVITRPELGGMPNAHVEGQDPLELLMRLRSVTAARYAGDETVREARCRKIAVTVQRHRGRVHGLGG